jgi:hypothetical protein
MKKNIGCSIIRLSTGNLSLISEYKKILDAELLEGRQCLFIWEASAILEKHAPFENVILNTFLESPSTRNKNDTWVYFGSGAVRTFDKPSNLSKTYFWLILLRNGPKAYTRVKHVSADMLKISRIPVGDFAFTRDVANNVWHLRDTSHWSSILVRFKNLTSWPDEKVLVVTPQSTRRRVLGSLNLSLDDIPKVIKITSAESPS